MGGIFCPTLTEKAGAAKVSLAGIHYPDTTGFDHAGVIDVTEQLAKLGWFAEGRRLFMADHYRAAADMVVKWALSESRHCNVGVAEWFSSPECRQELLMLLDLGKPEASRNGQTAKNGSLANLALMSAPPLFSSRIQLPTQPGMPPSISSLSLKCCLDKPSKSPESDRH